MPRRDRGGQDDVGIPQGFEQLVATAKAQGLRLSSAGATDRATRERTAKMLHLKQETERIAAKEVDGLSEGQQRQVERNTQRLTELTEHMDRMDQIYRLSASSSVRQGAPALSTAAAKGGKGYHGGDDSDDMDDDDDNDDFFDRTERKKRLRGKMVVPALSAARSQWSAQMEAAAAAGRGSPNRRSHYAPSSRTPGQGGSR